MDLFKVMTPLDRKNSDLQEQDGENIFMFDSQMYFLLKKMKIFSNTTSLGIPFLGNVKWIYKRISSWHRPRTTQLGSLGYMIDIFCTVLYNSQVICTHHFVKENYFSLMFLGETFERQTIALWSKKLGCNHFRVCGKMNTISDFLLQSWPLQPLLHGSLPTSVSSQCQELFYIWMCPSVTTPFKLWYWLLVASEVIFWEVLPSWVLAPSPPCSPPL